MSIEKLKRVMWRLEELPIRTSNKGYYWYSLTQIISAIMDEIGTDSRTIINNIRVLIKVGYIKRLNRYQFILNKDKYT